MTNQNEEISFTEIRKLYATLSTLSAMAEAAIQDSQLSYKDLVETESDCSAHVLRSKETIHLVCKTKEASLYSLLYQNAYAAYCFLDRLVHVRVADYDEKSFCLHMEHTRNALIAFIDINVILDRIRTRKDSDMPQLFESLPSNSSSTSFLKDSKLDYLESLSLRIVIKDWLRVFPRWPDYEENGKGRADVDLFIATTAIHARGQKSGRIYEQDFPELRLKHIKGKLNRWGWSFALKKNAPFLTNNAFDHIEVKVPELKAASEV